ncbi:armadillo-type protein [Cokeromyces recurvatus]|uniref:armadillo-type protein n=1 Tax=Cokeromyces recurvatus TaxID=90255 RepID=UPI002220E2CC|nr:armadillo-type protein [Cokeromyces recurvatus]KAI7907433.1 armadillo-type protein [Cokeromyces recurvatus]
MNSTQSQASTNPKPVLHGVKIKQRKGVQKANAKHEPEIFRDQLLAHLKTIEEGDFEAISTKLDILGNTLEYRKYGDSLFEILITGGILETGGNIDDDAERSPFCIFAAQDETSMIKKYVEVFNKLIRRYKYLQRILRETLENLLQFVNKWQAEENSKLAKATGLFICNQLTPASVLKVLFQDYLMKDGYSLAFTTTVFRTVMREQSIEQLGRALTSEGLNSRILDFFPPNKRDEDCLIRHFEAEDMKEFVEYYRKNKKNSIKNTLLNELSELVQGEASNAEVISFIKTNMNEGGLTESDVIPIIWQSMMNTVDMMSRSDQIESQVLRAIGQWTKILEEFCSSPKTEIVLLQKVQASCYEDVKLTKYFRRIIQTLYKNDVLSDNAILYWNDRAHLTQGKTLFLKQLEPFVNWLRDNDDSSDEDSD